MSEHTKEPWHLNDAGDMILAGKDMIADLFDTMSTKANARRIVACVNACEGITTDEIEHGDIALIRPGSQGSIKAERDRLASLNRELVEAASEAQCECSMRERESGHRVGCWLPNLQAVLAKVKSTRDRASGERDPENHQPTPKE